MKSDKRKEQKSLLKKIQIANEKISNLENALSQAQDDAKSQSSKVRHPYFHIWFIKNSIWIAELLPLIILITNFINL